jgi:hypothetical protein
LPKSDDRGGLLLSSHQEISGFRYLTGDDWQLLSIVMGFFVLLQLGGRGLLGRQASLPTLSVCSLTAIYFFFVIGSYVYTAFSASIPMILLCILAVVGILRAGLHLIAQDLLYMAIPVLILFPLIWLATVINQAQWDDYTHWLVSANYLLTHDHLPTFEKPVINHSHPTYPWARAMLHSWVNKFSDGFTINVQPIFNVLFSSTLLGWAPVLVRHWPVRSNIFAILTVTAILAWSVVFLALSLNNQILVSSYADPIFCIVITHLILFYWSSYTVEKKRKKTKIKLDLCLNLLFMAPLVIKSSGIFFSIICLCSFGLLEVFRTIRVECRLHFKKAFHGLGWIALHLLPALVLFFVWRDYSLSNGLSASFEIAESNQWNFHNLHLIVYAAFSEVAARPYAYLAFCGVAWVLLRRRARRAACHDESVSLLTFGVFFFAGTLMFQLLAYCIVFTEYEAIRAKSFNRYMAPAGFMIFVSILIIGGKIATSRLRFYGVNLAAVSVIAFWLLIYSNQSKIAIEQRFSPALIGQGQGLRDALPEKSKLLILDLYGNGFNATVLRYYLDGKILAHYRNETSLSKNISQKKVSEWLSGYDFVYILSGPKNLSNLIIEKQKIVSFKKSGGGIDYGN